MTLKFNIEIECDSTAFDLENDGTANEVARILHNLCHGGCIRLMAKDMRDGADKVEHSLRDFYGTRVGTASFTGS